MKLTANDIMIRHAISALNPQERQEFFAQANEDLTRIRLAKSRCERTTAINELEFTGESYESQ